MEKINIQTIYKNHNANREKERQVITNFIIYYPKDFPNNYSSYLHGSSLNLVTPTDETRITLFSEEGNADTRFLTPSQSSKNTT